MLNFGIFGFLILLVMVLRPQGLLPERRRAMELTEGIGAGDAIGSESETNVDVRQP